MELAIGKKTGRSFSKSDDICSLLYKPVFFLGGWYPMIIHGLWPVWLVGPWVFFPSRISYTHCFLTWDGVSGGFTFEKLETQSYWEDPKWLEWNGLENVRLIWWWFQQKIFEMGWNHHQITLISLSLWYLSLNIFPNFTPDMDEEPKDLAVRKGKAKGFGIEDELIDTYRYL